jgi:glycine/D-amino acid oxidase-like deaminating enzyme
LTPPSEVRVAVVGAGIQGSTLALALVRRGIAVDLFDAREQPMLGASAHGEGKLHLGFVYANDPDRDTHGLMAQGSLAFTEILRDLTGRAGEIFGTSESFYYAVADDSLLAPDLIRDHFELVDRELREQGAEGRYPGLGSGPTFRPCTRLELERLFDPTLVVAAFWTAERSVWGAGVASLIRAAIAEQPRITFHGGAEILGVELRHDVLLRIGQGGEVRERRYPAAANCAWDGRLVIDHSAGVPLARPWLFRFKASLRVHAPEMAGHRLPSTTIVLGPFGDFVDFGNGHYYLSWYPLFKLGQTDELDGRQLHRLLESADRDDLSHRGIEAMAQYVPDLSAMLGRASRFDLGGGVIFARGASDIDDARSELHRRSSIGASRHGPYVTIDTGKYCMAPLHSLEAAKLLEEIVK